MKKTDFNGIMKKCQPLVQKTGEKLAEAVKAAEKDVAKMYKIAQTHVEIQMKNIQKEKIYHEIGKCVAGQLMADKISVPGLEKYKKKLAKINAENEKNKKALSRPMKTGGKKKNRAKKAN